MSNHEGCECGGECAECKQRAHNKANFASESQRKYLWSQEPDIAESWTNGEHTSDSGHRMPAGPGGDVQGPQARRSRAARRSRKMTKNEWMKYGAELGVVDDLVVANGTVLTNAATCPECGGRMEGGECQDCGWKTDERTHNAAPFQTRHDRTGQYLPTDGTSGKQFGNAAKGGYNDKGHWTFPGSDDTRIQPTGGTARPDGRHNDAVLPTGVPGVRADESDPHGVTSLLRQYESTQNAFPPSKGNGQQIQGSNEQVAPPQGTAPAAPPVPDPKQASQQAAAASVQTGAPAPMEHAKDAHQAAQEDDSDQAADSHAAAADAHEEEAGKASEQGDHEGAMDHTQAAALHRKAADVHAVQNRNNEMTTQNAWSEAARQAAVATRKAHVASVATGSPGNSLGAAMATGHAETGEHAQAARTHDINADGHKVAAQFVTGKKKQLHVAAAEAHEQAAQLHRQVGSVMNTHNSEEQMTTRNAKTQGSNSDESGPFDFAASIITGGGDKPGGADTDTDASKGRGQGEHDPDWHEETARRFKTTRDYARGEGETNLSRNRQHQPLQPHQVDPRAQALVENVFGRSLAEINEDLALVANMKREEKIEVVKHLVSNLRDPQQINAVGNQLMQKPLAELKQMALLVPTRNQSYQPEYGHVELTPVQAPLQGEPVYTGQAAPLTAPTSNTRDDDALDLPTMNWGEEADGSETHTSGNRRLRQRA